jgi:hypothetical protein
MPPIGKASTFRISAITASCRSRPTAECVSCRWRRRRSRCRRARPRHQGHEGLDALEDAVDAQKGVMEFLLINHPLDCPICDQGGECQLQDLAVGYGGSSSRYDEDQARRVEQEPGPLDRHRHDALHPLHALRALRAGNRGRDGAGHDRPRRACRDHHLRGPDRGFGAVRQRDRLVSRRRADVQTVPLFRPHVGARAPPSREPALRPRLESHRAGEAEPRDARSAARERGDQRGWLSDKDRFATKGSIPSSAWRVPC